MPSAFQRLFAPSRPSTPPRSPHTGATGLSSYFDNGSSADDRSFRRGSLEAHSPSSRSTSRYSPALRRRMGVQFLRPSRRELVLVLLTLGFSYVLFASVQEEAGASRSKGASWASQYISGSRLGKLADPSFSPSSWNFWSGSGSARSAATCDSKEADFWAGARQYGTTPRTDTVFGSEGQGPDDEVLMSKEERLLATKKVGHAPGWTMMERAYVYNGSVYVVTEDRLQWPDLDHMTSTGKEANGNPGNAEERYPTGEEIKFINSKEAAALWDNRVEMMGGLTWLFNDGQFIDHYYHFAAELLMGAWRCTAAADPNIGPKGETTVVPPRRAWFLHQDQVQWRDKPRFNPHILYTLFPSISLLYPADWEDMKNITIGNPARPRAFMFEKVLYADRSSAFYGPYTGPTSRTVASSLYVGKTTRWWWEPIRRQVLRAAGLSDDILDRNLEGLGAVDPMHFAKGEMALPKHAQPIYYPPGQIEPIVKKKGEYQDVVTYISRQGSRRHLTQESHDDLVRELEKKRQELGFELVIVQAEKLSIEEQLALAGRTTIMLGVHGNGLTHLIWMPATPRSAVIEMYIRGGFARDYQWTAHALGMRHYGINHDIVYTIPYLPPVEYPDGFHGTEITVDGKTVADIVAKQLTGAADEIEITHVGF